MADENIYHIEKHIYYRIKYINHVEKHALYWDDQIINEAHKSQDYTVELYQEA